MAIFSPILGDLRGSIGDNTFSSNKGGPYVRRRGIPTNPQSSRQTQTRTHLGSLASHWTSTLNQAERDGWDVYAQGHPIKNSLGADILISGLAWFVKANARLLDAGEVAVETAPVGVAPAGLTAFSVDVSAITTADVTFTVTPTAADQRIQLFASLPVSLGSLPNLAQCRLVGYSTVAQASPWAATMPHNVPTGLREVFYAAVMTDEGLISAYLQAIDDVDY